MKILLFLATFGLASTLSAQTPPVPGVGANTASDSSVSTQEVKIKGAKDTPEGPEVVSFYFPEPTEIKDIIKIVAAWSNKNFIMGGKNGGGRSLSEKVQIISSKKVTKEEAYQTFLSALASVGLTTVETGKLVKIMPVATAKQSNLPTYLGRDYAPRTDQMVTQIIPLKYIDAKDMQTQLKQILGGSSRSGEVTAYTQTNTLIVSSTGNKIRRILEIIKLLDVRGQQPHLSIVPIRYADAKDIVKKLETIFPKGSSTKGSRSGKITNKFIVDERSNSIAVFGPPRTIDDVKNLVRKFDIKLDDPSRQSTVHVRPLDYANAEELAATLNALAGGQSSSSASSRNTPRRIPGSRNSRSATLSSRNSPAASPSIAQLDGVKITADKASNSLLIIGSRAGYQAINSIVRKLDIRRSQVYVESDIMDVNTGNRFEFSSSIFAGVPNDDALLPVTWQGGSVGNLIASSAIGNAQTTGAQLAQTFSENLTIGVLSQKTVDIPGLGPINPGGIIKLIKADSNTKTLSSPQILTSNNEEASIVVKNVQYFEPSALQGAGAGATVAVSRPEKVEAEVSLTITPNISHSNYVSMEIDINADSFGPPSGNLPTVNTRKTKQKVTVKNKQTIIISGLVRNDEIESFDKVPLLGDIPLLGWLFRNSSTNKSRSNLLVFLTPYIIHGAEDLADVYLSKRKEMDDFMATVYGGRYKESAFYERLPNFKQGRYVRDPVDAMEQQRRDKMLKEMYEGTQDTSSGNISSMSNYNDIPVTVPVSITDDSPVSEPVSRPAAPAAASPALPGSGSE